MLSSVLQDATLQAILAQAAQAHANPNAQPDPTAFLRASIPSPPGVLGQSFAPGANPALAAVPVAPLPGMPSTAMPMSPMRPVATPDAIPSLGPLDLTPSVPVDQAATDYPVDPTHSYMPGVLPPLADTGGGAPGGSIFTGASKGDEFAQALAKLQEAGDVRNKASGHPAFRTVDLLGLLPALLLGRQAPQYLAGFLGGKGEYAQQDFERGASEADRVRANLAAQAQQLYNAGNTRALVAGRNAVAGIGMDKALGVQGLRNEGSENVARIRGRFTLQAAKERADAARDVALTASRDRRLSGLLKMAQGPVSAERGVALNALRDDPDYGQYFGGLTDAEIGDAVKATAREQELIARAAEHDAKVTDLKAHAGYLGALATRVNTLTPAELEDKKAAAVKLRADARASLGRLQVAQAQASLIQQKADNYLNEYRLKYSEVQGKLSKLSEKAGLTSADLSAAKNLYQSQVTIAQNQLKRILSMEGGNEPDANSPHITAWNQAVQDEKEGLDKLKALDKTATAMTATTSGYNVPGPSGNPLGNAAGAMAAAAPPTALTYVGGNNPANQVKIGGYVKSIAQHIADANRAIRDHVMTLEDARNMFRLAGVTVR